MHYKLRSVLPTLLCVPLQWLSNEFGKQRHHFLLFIDISHSIRPSSNSNLLKRIPDPEPSFLVSYEFNEFFTFYRKRSLLIYDLRWWMRFYRLSAFITRHLQHILTFGLRDIFLYLFSKFLFSGASTYAYIYRLSAVWFHTHIKWDSNSFFFI